jgi:hypothetical protein
MVERPFIGDIKINRDKYPVGTPLDEIVDFDVWDGRKWVPASEANELTCVLTPLHRALKLVKDNG